MHFVILKKYNNDNTNSILFHFKCLPKYLGLIKTVSIFLETKYTNIVNYFYYFGKNYS